MLRSSLRLSRGLSDLCTRSSRGLFTQEYLGGEKLAGKREEYLRALEAAASSPASSSPLLLLSDDVRRLLYTVRTSHDLSEAASALRVFVGRSASARVQNASVQRTNRLLSRELLLLCRAMAADGGMEVADSLMQDQEFVCRLNLFGSFGGDDEEDGGPGDSGSGGGSLSKVAPGVYLAYGQILYDCGRFDDLFSFFDGCLGHLQKGASSGRTPLDLLTLSLAACLRHPDRPAAFDRATRYMGRAMEDADVHFAGRAGCVYALLAARCGQLAAAHEELAFVKDGSMRTNLQVYLYTRMGRLEDAIQTMEETVRQPDVPAFRRRRPRFSVQVVKELTSAVEKAEEGDNVKKRLAVLFNRMDDLAEIAQMDLESMVLAPIYPQRADFRQRQRQQFQQQQEQQQQQQQQQQHGGPRRPRRQDRGKEAVDEAAFSKDLKRSLGGQQE